MPIKAFEASSPHYQPPALVWPLALLGGFLLAAGALNYSPDGRINVLVVWSLWALLPLLASVMSLVVALGGAGKPWLFRWGRQTQWYPDERTRWRMFWLLQLVWCVVAIGLLVGFSLHLLLTDLAFGWSSTVIFDASAMTRTLEVLAAPWSWLWPTAVPDASLLDATRFQRIDPEATSVERAGDWWPFLMASLLFYHLLPRMGLLLAFYCRWRQLQPTQVAMRSTTLQDDNASAAPPLETAPFADWKTVPSIGWEQEADGAIMNLGLADWRYDQAAFLDLLARQPTSLCWCVPLQRSPVAELGDFIRMAREAGVTAQGLYAYASQAETPDRQQASWQSFARQHHLTWLVQNTSNTGSS